MNISGIPLQVTLTGLPAGNTPAEAALENIFICENDITDVLWQRWTACYMLYDFIQTHMSVWECDRLTVEFHVARVMAELFTVKQKEEKRESGAPGSPFHLTNGTAALLP